MYTTTEGIILKQVKALGGRRMITIFSKDYGKISCGTSITEGGKNKTALALRPFTHGKYELYKNKDSYNIVGAETLKSYYSIGEDVDKFMNACHALELTDKLLFEDEPSAQCFKLLADFLPLLAERKKAYSTLLIGYEIKLLTLAGVSLLRGIKAGDESLPYAMDTDIIQSVEYYEKHSLSELENIALNKDLENKLKALLRQYYSDNLGINSLKSDSLII